jgi:hypothetical protein
LEKGCKEKRVAIELYGAYLASRVIGSAAQRACQESLPELGIQSVPATISLEYLTSSVNPGETAVLKDIHSLGGFNE